MIMFFNQVIMAMMQLAALVLLLADSGLLIQRCVAWYSMHWQLDIHGGLYLRDLRS